MIRNYLKGTQGDQINALMAAAAFNFRRFLRKLEREFIFYSYQTIDLFNLFLSFQFLLVKR